MHCPKCGSENPDDAQFCSFCNCALPAASQAQNVNVRVSRLAMAAFLCAILSILFPPFGFVAIILGIVSFIMIDASGGKQTGTLFAILAILVPVFTFFVIFVHSVLLRPRSVAFRMTCGTNLSGIGKAMLIYANDYEDQLPRAAGPASKWGPTPNWQALDRPTAFGLSARGTGGQATISASLYLLIKYAEVTPKTFVCTNDSGTTEFKPAKYRVRDKELIELWDFGPNPAKHYSYSYHMPYGQYALTSSSLPGMAVAADRTPWIDSPAAKAKDFSPFKPDLPQFGGTTEQARYGNSISHKEDGQQVLFMDCHVEFAKRSYCAIDDDNIYTHLPDGLGDPQIGKPPVPFTSQPGHKKDSFLVHDPPARSGK
jgi:hypothetical protein